jgi:hypothetical protein
MELNKLKSASEHIFYEIEMLNISAIKAWNARRRKVFAEDRRQRKIKWDAQIKLNLALDSFAIHARNILELFIGKINTHKKNIKAQHYLTSEKFKEFQKVIQDNILFINKILDKANHQVAHLTFDRLNPRFIGINKAWDLTIIHKLNEIIRNFLNLVQKEKLCDKLVEWRQNEESHSFYVRRYIER